MNITDDLISLKEATARGIERVRQPIWANPMDHLKLDIINGGLGPWFHLFSPFNMEWNGRDPVDILSFQIDCETAEYLPYSGPHPDSEEYKICVESFRRKPTTITPEK